MSSRRATPILVLMVALGDFSACSSSDKEQNDVGLFRRNITIEAQLASLAKAGLILNAGVVEADLTAFHSRVDLERNPFVGLVEALGNDLEREPFTPVCDHLWMCDFERIEDHGAYRDVLLRLERMTGRALSLSGIADHVDVDAGEAWVEFEFRGDHVRWDLRVDNDWLDPQVLTNYDSLLKTSGSAIRLYLNQDDYGQVAFLGAFSPEEKAAFDKLTRIKLLPLTGR